MNVENLDWLDAPPAAAIAAANILLDQLDASPRMAEMPLPPRLSKLVLEAAERGVPEKGCAVAAVLSGGERGSPDLLSLIDSQWQPQTQHIHDQLRRSVPGRDRKGAGDEALLRAVLTAFPDRVARRRPGSSEELLLSAGGSARFPDCRHEIVVALDIEQRKDRGLPLIRLVAGPIALDWLLDRATERVTLEWNRTAERVEQVTALLYDSLVLDVDRVPSPRTEASSALLVEKALETDIGRFADRDALAARGKSRETSPKHVTGEMFQTS